jgi:hypothetical protein
MNVENRMYPEPEQLAFLRQGGGPDGPIVMVNLLKFLEKAQYEDGRDPELSGREAYHRYGRGVEKLVRACGGRVLFPGDVSGLSLGRVRLKGQLNIETVPTLAALLAPDR